MSTIQHCPGTTSCCVKAPLPPRHLHVSTVTAARPRSLLQTAAVVMSNGPLVLLGCIYVVRDPRVIVAAVVVGAHLLGVVQELPGKERLNLRDGEVVYVSENGFKNALRSLYELNHE